MTTTTKLHPKTIEIVKSTVPVLETHGEQITKRFYELMFSNHPELLHIFNHANQKQGRQQRALAAAVYAAARYIDQLDAILPVVRQIGHKHRSLGIKPEQYPIVGKHLLLAIKDVLGDAATDEVITAWAEAYEAIASVFIQVEKELYDEAAAKHGGWRDFRRFVVVKKVKESGVITSFYLEPEDGKAISDYLPGQYVSVKLSIPGETYTHIRQYSLSDAPGKGYYRISVKREAATADKPAGIVSNYLHDHVQEGDVLELSAPAGDFTLDLSKTTPVVFISGGVGITPLLSMAHTLAIRQPTRPAAFLHAALNGRVHAFDEELRMLAERPSFSYHICYESPSDEDRRHPHFGKEGRIDLAWMQSVIPTKDADFYFCGPVPFMKTVYRALKQWGVPEEHIHYEFFGPAGDLTKD
ncbi:MULTISPECIES: NO-inducible flavohemoprotein [Geobacillus]|uniref:Flavohemoprotein n=1 Tax=Geobacillus zalihae TaxID=213419 RepID=A0A1V9CI19_9BACL|nr:MULTISPECIES: NO-inducible flavohemoprotein [Geobacillus]EPR28110.1 Flavohemoprotein [Geobacillus sp. WSUCF1]OQP17104.1 nitric oxide dioxygenase [Geobacillus zalihae]OQP21311.1 nitric oxide dioxygenase [Geobacillus zalihae]QNU18962.1 NO-inducible flavohemoprotein [Geobacillus zalihae]QNU25089.1 NO-inducible flavohemoprotein [Geobacillus zalihae]